MLRVGICGKCGFDWDTPADELVERIGQIGAHCRQQLEQLRGEVGERGLRVRPSDAVWSPLEYMSHMRDVADFYLDRIERIITEDRPQLPVGVGFAALAETRRYNEEDNIESVVEALDQTASAAAARLETLGSGEWARVGIGSDGDERDVLVLARRLAHEGHHHLLDLTTRDSEMP